MVTLAQRITELREERGLSRPALAQALGLPKLAIEKFETGRLTPGQDQQQKLAAYFGVPLSYLRGETDDPAGMDTWLNGGDLSQPEPESRPAARPVPARTAARAAAPKEDGAVFGALLKSPSFQELLRETVLEVLRTPEGQALLQRAVRRELDRS